MAHKMPKTKAAKKAKVHTVLKEYKEGQLNIGKSKKKVKSRKQAIAVAMKMSGQSKKKSKRK